MRTISKVKNETPHKPSPRKRERKRASASKLTCVYGGLKSKSSAPKELCWSPGTGKGVQPLRAGPFNNPHRGAPAENPYVPRARASRRPSPPSLGRIRRREGGQSLATIRAERALQPKFSLRLTALLLFQHVRRRGRKKNRSGIVAYAVARKP